MKTRNLIFIFGILFVLALPFGFVEAREFTGALHSLQDDLREILMVVGGLALMIAGGAFYMSRQLGVEKLTSALIGTVVFAASSTIFSLLYRSFN